MSSVRSVALKSIAKIAGKGDQHIIKLLAPLLRDAEYPVRCSAVMAIAEVANTGDGDAITLLATRLEDPDYPVRCATAMALAQVAPKGNKRVIGLVSGLRGRASCSGKCGKKVSCKDGGITSPHGMQGRIPDACGGSMDRSACR